MKKWAKVSVAGLGAVSAGAGIALWSGGWIWKRETERMAESMKRSAVTTGGIISFADLGDLPVPVARYFRFALKDGRRYVRTARIRHKGEFKLNDSWIPFKSDQHFSANPPGFVWDADMRMNPLAAVRVRDSYLGGQASMTAKVLSLIPMVDSTGDNELASGALQRYLAESVWFPTALVPREELQWTSIDNDRALATLTDNGISVSLEFSFDENGGITEIFSHARMVVDANGEYKPLPWACRVFDYEERDGMMIPLRGEVEWRTPDGPAPYWRGQIVGAEYDLFS